MLYSSAMKTDIGELNRQYWRQYAAGSTPSAQELPTDKDLRLLPPRSRTLDVGCGGGALAEYLAKKGFESYGIDLNPHEIEANRNKRSGVTYSQQDILVGTDFPSHHYSLLTFCYVLTSIHKPQWPALTREVNRLLKPGGLVWLIEPLVSPDYNERYALASKTIDDDHALFVFKDPALASELKSNEDIAKAEENGLVSRITRHYTEDELNQIFHGFKSVEREYLTHTSPSGFAINAVKLVLQKQV